MQDSGSLAVFKVIARDQDHYKGPSGTFVTYSNLSCVSLSKPLDFSSCLSLSAMALFLFFSIISGPGSSKLTTSLVNVSFKFRLLISEIHKYFC